MRRFTIDLEFDEKSGDTRLVVDFQDDSMTAIEINESIRSGEMLEEVLKQAGLLLGEDVANQVRSGKLPAICLDHHPELRNSKAGILINQGEQQKQGIEQ